MQIKKENIRNRILKVARKEFVKEGFQGTTMREIAEKADVSFSNIYNYFRNKDEIFKTIVHPTIIKIKEAFDFMENLQDQMFEDKHKWSFEWHEEKIDAVADFIDTHRENFNLILFKSHGSSLFDFKEYLIERYTSNYINFIQILNEKSPGFSEKISEFFMHNISSFYMNIVSEIIMHNIPCAEMKKYMKEIITFVYYGNKALLEWDLLLKE